MGAPDGKRSPARFSVSKKRRETARKIKCSDPRGASGLSGAHAAEAQARRSGLWPEKRAVFIVRAGR